MQRPFTSSGANVTTNPVVAARELLHAGRFDEAGHASLAILARDPANVDAHLVLGAACLRRGRIDDARRSIDAIFALAPGHPGASLLHADVLHAGGDDEAALGEVVRALAAIFGLAHDADAVLRTLLAMVASEDPAKWSPYEPVFAMFGYLLSRSRAAPDAAWLDAAAPSPIVTLPDAEFTPRFAACCALLGFARDSPVEWNRAVFDGLFMAWMRRALDTERFEPAFEIERLVYEIHVKQLESEAHFARTVAQWKDPMRAAGARFAASLPAIPRGAPGALPRIAFFVHNVTGLAHVQMVLNLIAGNSELAQRRFEPYVFCLMGAPDAVAQLRAAGAKVEVLAHASFLRGMRPALAAMRRRIAELGIDALVWVSLVLMMPFAFAMRLAPAQIWWAMKYHSLELAEIDGYLTGGGLEGGTKSIGGRTWLAGPVASQQWTAPEKAAEAAAVRGSLGRASVVFGSFGREEKLNSPEFLDAVARALKTVPGSLFLWTGRTRHAGIQRHLEAQGVAEQARFIGWVDTRLYAQVIDVFLDSFPFPCGFTLYEAAAAGRPVVLFSSAASADTGANALIGPLLDEGDPGREAARLARSIFRGDGEDLCLRAFTADEYVALAVRAGNDRAFRARAGNAYRAFVERFLGDRARAARIYADHFAAVIEAAKARGAGA